MQRRFLWELHTGRQVAQKITVASDFQRSVKENSRGQWQFLRFVGGSRGKFLTGYVQGHFRASWRMTFSKPFYFGTWTWLEVF